MKRTLSRDDLNFMEGFMAIKAAYAVPITRGGDEQIVCSLALNAMLNP